MNILISRCLLGEPCRYDGKSKPNDIAEALCRAGHRLIPVCPEVMGGLSTPRPPAERQPDGRVVNREGTDVTAQYRRGAELALETAKREGCTLALLKARSPSCGCLTVYDGSFSGTFIPGKGVAAESLEQAGIPVVDEEHIPPELFASGNQSPSKAVR